MFFFLRKIEEILYPNLQTYVKKTFHLKVVTIQSAQIGMLYCLFVKWARIDCQLDKRSIEKSSQGHHGTPNVQGAQRQLVCFQIALHMGLEEATVYVAEQIKRRKLKELLDKVLDCYEIAAALLSVLMQYCAGRQLATLLAKNIQLSCEKIFHGQSF